VQRASFLFGQRMTTNLHMPGRARWVLVLTALALGCSTKAAQPRPRPQVSEKMKEQVIPLKVSLGMGKGRDRVLTCDLTKEYVAINGDYRS